MADIRAVVLVEGVSDRAALIAFAKRFGRNLELEGVSIVAMGGASALGEFFEDLSEQRGPGVKLAGLCDEAEVGDFQRGLERGGLGPIRSRSEMELLGFFVCVADLEDELIRALGVAPVEQVIEAEGDLPSSGGFRASLRGASAPSRPSYGDSWARSRGARLATRACSWMRLTSSERRVPSNVCSRTSSPVETSRIPICRVPRSVQTVGWRSSRCATTRTGRRKRRCALPPRFAGDL